jgi:hypothetical protein
MQILFRLPTSDSITIIEGVPFAAAEGNEKNIRIFPYTHILPSFIPSFFTSSIEDGNWMNVDNTR